MDRFSPSSRFKPSCLTEHIYRYRKTLVKHAAHQIFHSRCHCFLTIVHDACCGSQCLGCRAALCRVPRPRPGRETTAADAGGGCITWCARSHPEAITGAPAPIRSSSVSTPWPAGLTEPRCSPDSPVYHGARWPTISRHRSTSPCRPARTPWRSPRA